MKMFDVKVTSMLYEYLFTWEDSFAMMIVICRSYLLPVARIEGLLIDACPCVRVCVTMHSTRNTSLHFVGKIF